MNGKYFLYKILAGLPILSQYLMRATNQPDKNARMQECKNARMQECKNAWMHGGLFIAASVNTPDCMESLIKLQTKENCL